MFEGILSRRGIVPENYVNIFFLSYHYKFIFDAQRSQNESDTIVGKKMVQTIGRKSKSNSVKSQLIVFCTKNLWQSIVKYKVCTETTHCIVSLRWYYHTPINSNLSQWWTRGLLTSLYSKTITTEEETICWFFIISGKFRSCDINL